MHESPAHTAAVIAACRLPALEARLALLAGDATNRAKLTFFSGAYPGAVEPGGGDTPIVSIDLTARAGVIDEAEYRILIDTPIEAQVTGADPATGTIPGWAALHGPAGDWWGNLTVSVEGGSGEVQLVQTGEEGGSPVVRWYNGGFARIALFAVQG